MHLHSPRNRQETLYPCSFPAQSLLQPRAEIKRPCSKMLPRPRSQAKTTGAERGCWTLRTVSVGSGHTVETHGNRVTSGPPHPRCGAPSLTPDAADPGNPRHPAPSQHFPGARLAWAAPGSSGSGERKAGRGMGFSLIPSCYCLAGLSDTGARADRGPSAAWGWS
jgi:hypothetical protein